MPGIYRPTRDGRLVQFASGSKTPVINTPSRRMPNDTFGQTEVTTGLLPSVPSSYVHHLVGAFVTRHQEWFLVESGGGKTVGLKFSGLKVPVKISLTQLLASTDDAANIR